MAAIGKIRKHSVLLMTVVGLALFLFIISSFLDNSTLSWLKFRSTTSAIDGKDIEQDYTDFYDQYAALAQIYFQTTSLDENQSAMIHKEVWNQLEEEILLGKEMQKAGLGLSKEEREDYMLQAIASLSTNNPDMLLGTLYQAIAGMAGPEAAMQFIQNVESYAGQEGVKEFYNAYKAIERLGVWNKQKQKLYVLLNKSLYYPTTLLEKLAQDNQSANVRMFNVPLSLPEFASVKPEVTDKEVEKWYKDHQYRFYNMEEARDIDMVVFQLSPTFTDQQTIKDSVYNRYQRLLATSDLLVYNTEESQLPLDSNYYKKDNIYIPSLKRLSDVPYMDSLLFKRPVGTMIEPFAHNDVWYYGKTFGKAVRPDSIQIALIRVDYKSINTKVSRTKKEAKLLLDSIYTVLQKNPMQFDSLKKLYSAIPEMDSIWITDNIQEKSLFNPMISVPINQYQKLELDMGLFIVIKKAETLPMEKVQYAIYTEHIVPSQYTIDSVNSRASKLASTCATVDELVAEANKQGLPVVSGKDVKSMDATIQQMQSCRNVVKWAFDKETKQGFVAPQAFNLNNNAVFIVAGVRSLKEVGTSDLENVKDQIREELEQEKKMEAISLNVEKAAKVTTELDSLAQKYNVFPMNASLSFAGGARQNYNIDGAGIVKIFNYKPSSTIHTVASKNGVFAFVVNSIEKSETSKDYQGEKMAMSTLFGQNAFFNILVDGLKKNATIKDNRHLRY